MPFHRVRLIETVVAKGLKTSLKRIGRVDRVVPFFVLSLLRNTVLVKVPPIQRVKVS